MSRQFFPGIPALFLIISLSLFLISSGCISSRISTNAVSIQNSQVNHNTSSPVRTTNISESDCIFTENISTGAAPLTVQFSNPCPRSSLKSRLWGFGDGNASNQQNPVHTYTSPGTYEVTLTIDNGLGEISTVMPNYRRIFVLDHPVVTRNWTYLNQPSGYWIKIEPVGDKRVGDNLTIIATTNLSVGEDIVVEVYHPQIVQSKYTSSCISEAGGQEKVSAGKNGVNTTSFNINLTCFRVNDYVVIESAFNENSTDEIQFNIIPKYWIKIDPVSDKETGDVFMVNASTNLPAGEPVLVQVSPQPHHAMKNDPGWFSGVVENSTIMSGKNGINTISFTINTSSYFPAPYYITESSFSESVTESVKLNITPKKISQ